jgi:hypothetical protein
MANKKLSNLQKEADALESEKTIATEEGNRQYSAVNVAELKIESDYRASLVKSFK